MIHKQTSTFIIDLKQESYFGEYGLITGNNRSLSAKCRDFTECYVIKKEHFDAAAENYIEAIRYLKQLKESIENKDITPLKLKCYICH